MLGCSCTAPAAKVTKPKREAIKKSSSGCPTNMAQVEERDGRAAGGKASTDAATVLEGVAADVVNAPAVAAVATGEAEDLEDVEVPTTAELCEAAMPPVAAGRRTQLDEEDGAPELVQEEFKRELSETEGHAPGLAFALAPQDFHGSHDRGGPAGTEGTAAELVHGSSLSNGSIAGLGSAVWVGSFAIVVGRAPWVSATHTSASTISLMSRRAHEPRKSPSMGSNAVPQSCSVLAAPLKTHGNSSKADSRHRSRRADLYARPSLLAKT
jgi:hypothetical protein